MGLKKINGNLQVSGTLEGVTKVTVPANPSANTDAASKGYVDTQISDIREVAEGKCSTFVLSYARTIAWIKTYAQYIRIYLYNLYEDTTTDITEDVVNGDYDNATILNSQFNSQDDVINLTASNNSTYFIFNSVRGHAGGYYLVRQNQPFNGSFKTGDIVYVTETDVPDRWFSEYRAYKLETSKVDLTNVYKKNESLIPTSNNSYSVGSYSYTYNSVYSHNLYLYYSSLTYGRFQVQSNGVVNVYVNRSETQTVTFSPSNLQSINIIPLSPSTYDLGSSYSLWKDLYLAGKFYLYGSNQGTATNWNIECDQNYGEFRIAKESTRYYTFNTNGIMPASGLTLGSASYQWSNIYLSGKSYFGGTNNYVYKDSSGNTTIGVGGNDILSVGSNDTSLASNLLPSSNNSYDLGNSSYRWKDLYVGGNAYVGSHLYFDTTCYIIKSGNSLYLTSSSAITFGNVIRPTSNGLLDNGDNSHKWKDIYFAGYLKGGTTLTQAQYDALSTKDPDTFYFIEEE